MLRLLLVSSLAGCTVGAAARFEGSIDPSGHRELAASAVPAVGAAGFGEEGADVKRDKAWFALLGIGVGWGGRGRPFLSTSLSMVQIPGTGGGVGFTGGIHVRFDRSCVHWSLGYGVVGLVHQLHAEARVDQFGPNPRVTRAYHDGSAFIGLRSCDGRDGDSFEAGLAYELGIAELLFAPGP